MHKEEFKKFMDQQIVEIEKYKQDKLINDSNLDSNTCVFEWISKNAKNFRKKWCI